MSPTIPINGNTVATSFEKLIKVIKNVITAITAIII